jgi:uridine phosphorylase
MKNNIFLSFLGEGVGKSGHEEKVATGMGRPSVSIAVQYVN